MPSLTVPKIELKEQIENYRSVAFKNVREADAWYLNCANFIYDSYEAICELEENTKLIDVTEIPETITYLERLKTEASEFLDLLEDKYFDCKNFDRLNHLLGTLEEAIPAIITELKMLSKNLL